MAYPPGSPSIALSILLNVGALCCSPLLSSATPIPESDPRIGVILPLSGDLARFGEKIRQGIELAARQFRKESQLRFEDGQATRNGALSAFQKLSNVEGLRFFIGPFGPDQTFVVAPAGLHKNALFISASLCDERFLTLENVFCIYPSQRDQIAPLITLFEEKFHGKIRSIAMLVEEVQSAQPLDHLIAEYAHRDGTAIVSKISFPHDALDFRADLLRLKKKKPDLLIVGGLDPATVARIFKQAKEILFEPPYRWYLSEFDSRFFSDNREILEGVYTAGTPQLNPDFVEGFKKAYGFDPDLYHGLGYDSARTLLAVLSMGQGSWDKEKVSEALIHYTSADPAVRGFKFSEKRTISLELRPKIIRDGELVDALEAE